MSAIIMAFILGLSAGVWGYRSYVTNMIGKFPYTKCDYCKYRMTQDGLSHKKNKQE